MHACRIAYVNGRYLPHRRRRRSVEDRGYQFADGVYEVMQGAWRASCATGARTSTVSTGRSRALRIRWPMTPRGAAAGAAGDDPAQPPGRRARLPAGHAAAARRATMPFRTAQPSLVVTVRTSELPAPRELELGVGVITLPDERWAPLRHQVDQPPAQRAGASSRRSSAGRAGGLAVDRDGNVTEGATSNAYIVDRRRPAGHPSAGATILGGITRSLLLELARAAASGGRAAVLARRGEGGARGVLRARHRSCCR